MTDCRGATQGETPNSCTDVAVDVDVSVLGIHTLGKLHPASRIQVSTVVVSTIILVLVMHAGDTFLSKM